MNARRFLLSTLFLLSTAMPLAAQVNDTYVIPAAGSTAGAFGTRWLTRLSIFNPQTYSLRVSVTFLPTGGGQGLEAALDVPSNSGWFTDNALGDIFKLDGTTGSLLVATFPEDNPGVTNSVVARAFLTNSETYNNSPSGTYGQSIPGTWIGVQDYKTDGITAIVHGIRDLASQGWRTNVGAVNLGHSDVTLFMNVYDYDGHTILSKAALSIPARGHVQERLPVEVDRGTLEFFLDDPSGQAVVFPYTSTIDQLSGAPTYQNPVLLATAHTLYPASLSGLQLNAASVSSPGKKIDIELARQIRSTATRVGVVAMKAPSARQ